VGRFGRKWLYYRYNLFWQFVRVLKSFATWYASSSVVTLHSFCLRLFCVVHTSHNRHKFCLRSLRVSFLNIPYCFSVSSLAENKLFLVPKLSNVPTKFLQFQPLVSRYVHQQHYCICCLHYERYRHNITISTTNITSGTQIILMFLLPISKYVYQQHYSVCCLYHDRYPHNIPLSAINIMTGTLITFFFLPPVLKEVTI